MNIKELRETIARGWTHSNTEHLEMDSDLVEAIAAEVFIKIDNIPNLGCATTIEIINELQTRAMLAQVSGERWVNYKTVKSH